ncbi:MAG: YdcF family protein [Actinomycetota bacterium]|nr:YdcF family protein [Actinomycetota bacterium]
MIGLGLKFVKYMIVFVVFSALIIFAANLYRIYTFGRTSTLTYTPVAVVLGSSISGATPSSDFKARLDHTAYLYKNHYCNIIVTTGGPEVTGGPTEASVARAYLISSGVPSGSIVEAATGADTYQSLVAVKNVVAGMGTQRAIFVTDPFHALRVSEIATQLGMTDFSSPDVTPLGIYTTITYYLREDVAISGAQIVGYKFLSLLEHGSGQ